MATINHPATHASANPSVYRKTAAGQAEVGQRRAGLTPRARAVLVMVNGVDSVATLTERLGPEVPDTVRLLIEQGLVESAVAEPLVRDWSPAIATAAVPATAIASAPATEVAPAPALRPAALSPAMPAPSALHGLVRLLSPHFGPDATRVAQGALRARSLAEFNTALDGVAERLAIHLGRKAADQLLAPLRQPVD